ncbi:MAG: PAS domain-containing protein [Chloroflexota bacterium]
MAAIDSVPQLASRPPFILRSSFRLAFGYALASILWVTFSSYIVSIITPDRAFQTLFEDVKAWVFVGVTALGLYYIVRRMLQTTSDLTVAMQQQALAYQAEMQRYQALLDASEDLIALMDAEARFLAVPNRAAALGGFTSQQMIGKTVRELYNLDFGFEIEEIAAQVIQTGKSVRIQREIIAPDRPHWFDIIFSLLIEKDTTPRMVLVVGRDVTERIKAAEKLHHRTDQYRSLLDTISLIGHTLRRDEILQGLLEKMQIVDCNHIEIFIGGEGVLHCAASNQGDSQTFVGTLLTSEEQTAFRQLAQSGLPQRGSTSANEPCPWKHLPSPACWLIVPLVGGGQWDNQSIGYLLLSRNEPQPFDDEEQELAYAFGRSAAVALSNAQLYENLERVEANYRQVLNSVEDMVYQCDANGVQVYLNAKGRNLEELDETDNIAKSWFKLVHPEDRHTSLGAYFDQFSKGDVLLWKNRIVGKYGRITHISHRARALRDANGKLIGMFGVGRDITGNVQVTETVARHIRQLTILNRILQVASAPIGFESMLDALLTEVCEIFNADAADIYLIDANMGLLHWLANLGYKITEEEIYQQIPIDKSLHGTAIRSGRVVIGTPPLDKAWLAKDQKDRVKAMIITPIWSSGHVRGVLTVSFWHERIFSEDEVALLEALGRGVGITIENARLYAETQSYAETITIKIEESTQELQKAVEQAKSADHTKSVLLSTVSHEMRSPLSSIIGFSNLIISRKPELGKTLEFATAINQEARRLSGLIDDFLDLQRLETNREIFHFTEINMAELIQDIVHKQQFQTDDLHTIKLDIMPVAPVYVDSNRLRQVVLNLLSNALKYSPDGGEITIRLWQEGQQMWFSIHDEGLGLAAQDMNHVFDLFYRGEAAERLRIRGTGLGLGLCREIIQIHNGHISVESPGPNLGATFTFVLPVSEPSQISRLNAISVRRTDQPLILSIDDDPNFQAYLAERLTQENYAVQILRFKVATASYIAELHPSLVVLGLLQADEKPGWGVLIELRQNPATRDIPVMICSILKVPEEAKKLGAASYVGKPVDESFLISEVNRLIVSRKENEKPILS